MQRAVGVALKFHVASGKLELGTLLSPASDISLVMARDRFRPALIEYHPGGASGLSSSMLSMPDLKTCTVHAPAHAVARRVTQYLQSKPALNSRQTKPPKPGPVRISWQKAFTKRNSDLLHTSLSCGFRCGGQVVDEMPHESVQHEGCTCHALRSGGRCLRPGDSQDLRQGVLLAGRSGSVLVDSSRPCPPQEHMLPLLSPLAL